jgi:TRAP-type C4-dicarboxylate transport system permease small subunit
VTTRPAGEKVREYWRRFEAAVIGALVVLALGVFLFGSLARSFAPALAIDWSEEVAIYLIAWATLLCGGAITADRAHVSANMLGHLLSPLAQRRLQLSIDVLVLGFCGLMFWLGIEGVLFAHLLDERSASTLQAPQAWVLYLALPVGMLLIVTRLALSLFLDRPHA